MTDFEKKPIKRGMTHKKFNEIINQPYGDVENYYGYKYGDVSSFLTWNRDENDKNKIKRLEKDDYTKRRDQINDGHIYDWGEEKLSRITTDIVFIGENMSADGKPLSPEFWFQNARRHKAIIQTFFGTEAEGAYFTDIIKTDRRILEILNDPSNGDEVKKTVLSRPDVQEDHLRLFNEELNFIGAVDPLLIIFGNYAEEILNQGLKKNILKESSFYAIKKINHYSSYRFLKGKDQFEEYKNIIREQLSDYITISEEYIPI
jgi:hypothetical protein